MSGSLQVRNLDDALIEKLKRRAARNGRSAEAEHREILRQALDGDLDVAWGELAALLRAQTAGRDATPSEALQHEGRGER